ncbi:MAG: S-methyl-5-thioribose-1-phosphate isomerase [Calditrichaeota bacterium]|nr:MAG: S-methyl-5-thioribose-1-phosphate isomerase [Calditrichota bacterium]MBL1205448.1 S-methyl-5-thioribose-1-phosphate isomerase [Calditrichota bacterium]NOG45277.1 S-methyl-5-thioribose-1-phosphate isomerase [Calditrichota bacterium]
MKLEAISFKNNTLSIIDQTLLPQHFKIITLDSLNKSIEAIKKLKVRGAPAIGIIAAYTIYIEAKKLSQKNSLTKRSFNDVCKSVASSRPTAVNLFWAVRQMEITFRKFSPNGNSILISELKKRAISIHKKDKIKCSKIGENGSPLIKNVNNVLTHCNAGMLATGGSGTALSVIYEAHNSNKNLHVYVDETRPLGQGARLTYFELKHNNVECTLLSDNAAGSLFAQKEIEAVIVGADRIAMNGDFANKIGTFPLAVLAKTFNIPFYVAAPITTFDQNAKSKEDIPIEMRSKKEILSFWNIDDELNYNVYNPAFDITESSYVSAFITDIGIIKKPFTTNIKKSLQL